MSSCEESSYTGDYFPLGYVLPAAATQTQSQADHALRWARAASLAQTLLFIVAALVLCGGGIAAAGLLLALTPLVLFIGSVLNPSGIELAASLAFLAGVMRFARDPAAFPRWAWMATLASGVVAILSWQLGPAFVLCDLLVLAVLLGGRRSRAAISEARGKLRVAAAVLVLAVVAFVVYGLLSGALHSSISFHHLGADLGGGWRQLAPTLVGAVGRFGAYNIALPALLTYVWFALVLGLWLTALRFGDRPEQAALMLAGFLTVAFPVVFYAFAQRGTGFGLQGRYALPVFALLPVVSGSVLARRPQIAERSRLVRLEGGVMVAWAILQAIAFLVNAHHWSSSAPITGSPLTPPGGWSSWTAVAITGAAAVAVAGLRRVFTSNTPALRSSAA